MSFLDGQALPAWFICPFVLSKEGVEENGAREVSDTTNGNPADAISMTDWGHVHVSDGGPVTKIEEVLVGLVFFFL